MNNELENLSEKQVAVVKQISILSEMLRLGLPDTSEKIRALVTANPWFEGWLNQGEQA